jgi:protein gp37
VTVEDVDAAWRADLLRQTPAHVRFLSLEPLLGHIPAVVLRDMDWVIVGGESGRRARPMDLRWARDVRDDCAAMGIPYFLKQLGGEHDKRDGDDAVLDGTVYREFPA